MLTVITLCGLFYTYTVYVLSSKHYNLDWKQDELRVNVRANTFRSKVQSHLLDLKLLHLCCNEIGDVLRA